MGTCVRDLVWPSVRRAPPRAKERESLGAEAVARELPRLLSLEDALRLTHLYAQKEQWDKFERAAMKWLRRYLDERSPTLKNFAKVVRTLEQQQSDHSTHIHAVASAQTLPSRSGESPGLRCNRMRVLLALVLVACALAMTAKPASAGSAKSWCAAVINVNTKYGAMKNKRYLLPSQVPLSAWKHVVDAILAGRLRFIALAPNSIRTAVKHQIAWYAKVKANHYSRKTPYPPLTRTDIEKLTIFQSTECGITFAGDWPLPPS